MPLQSPIRIPLRLGLGAFSAPRGGWAYNPVAAFGSDLVTWYGNSVDDLWRAQAAGGAVALYLDNEGTTPVTALEQTVGRINDLSGNEYHLTQPTATARGRLSARYNFLLATATLSTQSVTTIAASLRLTFSGAGSITLSGTATGTYSAGTHTITTTAGTLTLTVSGSVTNADLRLSAYPSSWPSYQRVTTANDYDTVGFPARLDLDGVDDRYFTGNIDLTSTDKLSVIATASRTGGTGQQFLAEIDTGASVDPGRFALSFSNNGFRYEVVGSAGGAAFENLLTYPALGVVQLNADIAGAARAQEVFPRWNGASASTVLAGLGAAGDGNFRSAPLSVGGRVASNRLNGDIFSLPMVVRRLATPEEITDAERSFGRTIGVLQ